MIERHPIAFYAHGCYVTSMSKKECERAVLKAAKYTKKKNLVYRRFKRGDDIFDTRTHNLADVSSFSPCAINMLLRIVESGSALPTNFDFPSSFIELTTCHA